MIDLAESDLARAIAIIAEHASNKKENQPSIRGLAHVASHRCGGGRRRRFFCDRCPSPGNAGSSAVDGPSRSVSRSHRFTQRDE
jgi:hypothetical protein